MSVCTCQVAGFCPTLGRVMEGRAREICQGIGIDPQTRAKYLALWQSAEYKRAAAGEPLPPRPPPPDGTHRLKTCAHRQRALRDAFGQPLTLVPP